MLQKTETTPNTPPPLAPEQKVEGDISERKVRRVVMAEDTTAVSLPNAPWDDRPDEA